MVTLCLPVCLSDRLVALLAECYTEESLKKQQCFPDSITKSVSSDRIRRFVT